MTDKLVLIKFVRGDGINRLDMIVEHSESGEQFQYSVDWTTDEIPDAARALRLMAKACEFEEGKRKTEGEKP